MRNALYFLIVTFIGSGFIAAGAFAADGEPDSIVVQPALGSRAMLLDDDRRLLPIRGTSLPISGTVDGFGTSRDPQQASIIEAIPTPTAFHTGAFLLAAIFVGRNYRKLLSRFVAA